MSAIILFEEKQVRRAWNKDEEKWYFAIADVIAVLTGSVDPGAYWRKLKERLKKEGNQTVTDCHGLKMTAADGKQRLTDVADTEQLLRLIQSIPSPKAEPFKLWLARVGYERLEEIENPELAARRMREIYQQKGYSEEWIEKRLRGIAVRDELTDEWKKRGVKARSESAERLRHPHRRNQQSHLWHDARRIQRLQSARESQRQSPRPHDGLGTHLHHARRSLHHRGGGVRDKWWPVPSGEPRLRRSKTPEVFPPTNKPPVPEAPSLAMPAANSNPRAAPKSPPRRTSRNCPRSKREPCGKGSGVNSSAWTSSLAE